MPPRRSGVREFEIGLDQFAEQVVPERFNDFKKIVAFEALESIVKKNPVDTGRSRNNWNVSLGTWSTKVIGRVKLGEDIFIVNNIHYINLLEDGHSQQARNPDGMVRRTVAEVELHYGGR